MNSNLLNTELNLIKNDIIRNLVKRSIEEVVPKWYEIKLASTKGNYNYSGTGIPITILSPIFSDKLSNATEYAL